MLGRGRGRARRKPTESVPEEVPPGNLASFDVPEEEPRGRGRGRGRGRHPGRQNPQISEGPLQRLPSSSNSPRLPEAVHSDEAVSSKNGSCTSVTQEYNTKTEDSNQARSVLSSTSNVPDAVDLPVRPGYGVLGRRIKLISNCFPIKVPSGYVYHYDVEIKLKNTPSGTSDDKKYRRLSTKPKRRAVSLLIETNENFVGSYAAFDGGKNLYTRKELKMDFPFRCQIVLSDEDLFDYADPRGPNRNVCEVEIKPVVKRGAHSCAIDLDSIHAVYEGKNTTLPREAITALETILSHGPCLRFTPMGRSFFLPPSVHNLNPLGGGLEIWFGYHQSIRLGQWKPFVNLDTTATTYLKACSISDFIAETLNVHDLTGISLNEKQIKRLSGILSGKEIKVTHQKHPRRYKIVKLMKCSPNQTYIDVKVKKERKKMTITQYFEETYNKVLKYPDFPCLNVAPESRNICLPVEVCELTPGQHNMSKLSQAQTSKMIEFTTVPPVERFKKINDVVKKSNFKADKCVEEFELEVSTRPLEVDGRVLDSPSVVYRGEKQIRPQNGSWNLVDTQFLSGAKISKSVLLNFSAVPLPLLKKFCELFVDIGTKLGMQIDGPPRIKKAAINCDKMELLAGVKEIADLAIIILPEQEESPESTVYSEIKRTAETAVGLTTQCLRESTLRSVSGKRGPQIVRSLCQQINVKKCGENNTLLISQVPNILHKPVIIIGADVTHPPPTARDRISVAACVGSLDSFCKRCAVSVRAQVSPHAAKRVLEIIDDLQNMLRELLLAFYRNTHKKPEKIIIYRDGVSEGEFQSVKNKEIACIRKACKSLENCYEPGITFVACQKRHHLRFRPANFKEGVGRGRNVPPGTVVDGGVTHPLRNDFFLSSQLGLNGTTRPSHYIVLEDDNDFSADDLQKMTFQLCHMYAACTNSISIPAPVAYAHLAAFRARKNLEAKMAEDSSSHRGEYPLTPELKAAVDVHYSMKNSMYFL